MVIVYLRLLMTLVLWGLAFLGGLRRLRNGYWDLTMLVLALLPFGLLAAQAYGGELLLRIYLFALPGIAFFAAALFLPKAEMSQAQQWRSSLGIVAATVLLLTGFHFTRYGNERADYYSPAEVEAMNYLYDLAEPGSQVVVLTDSVPWRFKEYAGHRHDDVPILTREGDMESILAQMADPQFPQSYLVVTRAQKAAAEMYFGMPPGSADAFEAQLLASPNLELLYTNPDANIFVLTEESSQ
jgi:hypothetical protein